jgi:glycosyltransferase involved in cell wall biosynthesis
MNIVYISKYTVVPEHGTPTRQYFLSKYLSKLPGNSVLLIGSQSTIADVPSFKGLYFSKKTGNLQTVILRGPKIDLGFNLKRVWSWFIFEFNIFRFRRKIKKFKPDIIIVSSLSILTFLSGVFLKKWLRTPLVIEVRDIYPLTLQEVGNFSRTNPVIIFLKWVERVGYKNADLLVSTLPNMKEHISTVLNKPFKFYWLTMGIDIDFFRANGIRHPGLNLNRKKSDFVVIYAGTIGKANALETIFESAEILQETQPHIKFVFIGGGPLKPFYQKKYSHLTRVVFLEPVSKIELPGILEQADLVINTWLNKPIYRFGISPNKWIDYMYAAKPILVAFNGFRCIIEDAGCGKFIPAENKFLLVDSITEFSRMNRDELNQIGENGKRYLLKKLTYELLAKYFNKKLIALKGVNSIDK